MKYGKSQIENNTTLTSLELDQVGVLAASEYTLHVHSNSIQVNSPLVYINQEHVSSTADVVEFENNGTGNLLHLNIDGVLATGKHGLIVETSSILVNADSALVKIWSTHASATEPALEIVMAGSSDSGALNITNTGTNYALRIDQNAVLASRRAMLIYSNQAHIAANSELLKIIQDNAAATQPCFGIQNDGSGSALRIDQTGDLLVSTGALDIYSNTAQTVPSNLLRVEQANASTPSPNYMCWFKNSSPSTAFLINVNHASGRGINVAAAAANYTAGGYALAQFTIQQNTSTGDVMSINNTGSGSNITTSHNSKAYATGKHALYCYSNQATIAADAALVKLVQDSATALEPCLEIVNDGTGAGIQITQNAAAVLAAIYIYNNNTGHGIYINDVVAKTTQYHALFIRSTVANINGDAAMVKLMQDHPSSTEPALEVYNDGTAAAIEIAQNGIAPHIHMNSINANSITAGNFWYYNGKLYYGDGSNVKEVATV